MPRPSSADAEPGGLRLAEHLAARLCHDISGSLGTVVNAIELAGQDATTAQEAMSLAEEASAGLGRQLRLLRAAWAGDGEPMDIAELLALAEGLPASRRLQIDGSAVCANVQFAAWSARLMLNLIMLADESLPRGGRLALAGHPEREIVALIEGPHAAWPEAFGACLADEAAAWQAIDGSRTLVGPLIALMARKHGARLSFLFPAAASPEPPPLLFSLPGSA